MLPTHAHGHTLLAPPHCCPRQPHTAPLHPSHLVPSAARLHLRSEEAYRLRLAGVAPPIAHAESQPQPLARHACESPRGVHRGVQRGVQRGGVECLH